MIGRLMRIRPDIFSRILFSIVLSLLIIGNINLDRFFYTKEVKIAGNSGIIGYPANQDTQRVTNIQEVEMSKSFTFEVEKANLKPTGVYRRIGQNLYAEKKTTVWLRRFEGKAYGQFYIAKLPSGEAVVLFLDEQAISLKSGTITLPIGEVNKRIVKEYFEEWKIAYQIETQWYVDMAGTTWRQSETAQNIIIYKNIIWAATLVADYLILTFIFSRLGWLPKKI